MKSGVHIHQNESAIVFNKLNQIKPRQDVLFVEEKEQKRTTSTQQNVGPLYSKVVLTVTLLILLNTQRLNGIPRDYKSLYKHAAVG